MNFHVKNAIFLADLLDNKFSFLGFKFGLDPIIGLVPGLGDLISLILSSYIILVALMLKLPREKVILMGINVIFDYLIGVIPIIGDLGDFVFKANQRNIQILKTYLAEVENVIEGEIVG